MAFKMKNQNLGKATRQAGKPESRRTESPVKFSWSSTLDKVGTGLTGLGMIPAIGNFADAANTALSAGRAGYAKYKGDDKAYKKHRNETAINAAAMIPGAGLAVGAGKLAAKGARAAKGADTVADVAKLSKTEKAANQTGKVIAKKGAKVTAKKIAKETVKESPKNLAKNEVTTKAKEVANKPKDKKPKSSKKNIVTKDKKPKKSNLA